MTAHTRDDPDAATFRLGEDITAAMRRLEASLSLQWNFLVFHHSPEENAYRQKETELGNLIASDTAGEQARVDAAQQVLSEVERYRKIYLTRLESLTSKIDQQLADCARFLPSYAPNDFPELHLWSDLTHRLVSARRAAVSYIVSGLEWDCVLPADVISGGLRTAVVDGQETVVMSEAATERVHRFAELAGSLREQSSDVEKEVGDERASLAQTLIGDEPAASPENATTRPASVVVTRPRQHPIQRRPWYRFGRLCWWAAAAIALLIDLLAADTFFGFVAIALVCAAVLFGIRSAVLYVTLGRPTLFERPGSGLLDLDEIEQELLSRDEDFEVSDFAELRRRYGRRAPATLAKEFVDKRLARARAEKKKILANADREGKTISVEALRASMMERMGNDWTPSTQAQYVNHIEQFLLRLEVRYGAEIPVSVVSEEVDLAEERAREAERA
jgi:hypothetical protein